MRANYRLQRLFVSVNLGPERSFEASVEHGHYLRHVLRMADGADVLVFNGRDGEWLARVDLAAKKTVRLTPMEQTRQQPSAPDLICCFAPLKVGRLDYVVQKAVEMGAGVLQPIATQHTQGRISVDKMRANAIEAAEQCGVLAVPACHATIRLDTLLSSWSAERRLIFCDEDAATNNPLPALQAIGEAWTSGWARGRLLGKRTQAASCAAIRHTCPSWSAHPSRGYGRRRGTCGYSGHDRRLVGANGNFPARAVHAPVETSLELAQNIQEHPLIILGQIAQIVREDAKIVTDAHFHVVAKVTINGQ
jgi:16S rRNA (uracil1498-N3)-methyltransferase